MSDLTCPKCRGTMRGYERNGVTVDQCGDCRGIFLDRGELEKLVNAESAFNAAAPPAASAPPAYEQPRPQQGYRQQPYRKRKRSFLSGLFDG